MRVPEDLPSRVDVRILGTIEIRTDGQVRVPQRRLARVLLGALALRPNTPTPLEWIVDALWTGKPPRSATANIRSYVAELRRLLRTGVRPDGGPEHGPRIESSCGRYTLAVTPASLDALRFDGYLAEGLKALAASRPGVAAGRLRLACGLWRGPLLDGTAIPNAVASAAATLEDQRLDALEAYVEARLELGQHAEVVSELAGLTVAYGLRERLWQQRMRALWQSGRSAEALSAYRRLAQLLRRELDTLPSPSTRLLYERIRRGDAAITP
jgi:DNA-binding SARP family transcriptional activator